MSTYEAPQPGDTLAVSHPGDDHFPYSRIVADVLEVEPIPPHETVTPDVPRWAMWVRIVESNHGFPPGSDYDFEYRPGTEHYWPGMGPGDFEWVQP